MGYKFNAGVFAIGINVWEYTDDKYFVFREDSQKFFEIPKKHKIHVSELKEFEYEIWRVGSNVLRLRCKDGRSFCLNVAPKDYDKIVQLKKVLSKEGALDSGMQKYLEQMKTPYNSEVGDAIVAMGNSSSNMPKEKDASVIGRAVAGQIIAGPTGAIVGALSAVDKNNKNNSYATTEKDASVIGRAVAGQIIAGPAGAVVGALSAVDKNNKNQYPKDSIGFNTNSESVYNQSYCSTPQNTHKDNEIIETLSNQTIVNEEEKENIYSRDNLESFLMLHKIQIDNLNPKPLNELFEESKILLVKNEYLTNEEIATMSDEEIANKIEKIVTELLYRLIDGEDLGLI